MTSEHLLDPAARPMLGQMPAMDFSAGTLPSIRAAINRDLIIGDPAAVQLRTVELETLMIPRTGHPGTLRVLWYRPAAASGCLPAFLHIHGGGYVVGTPEMMDPKNRELCAELGCAIFSVDYRLAPEWPHPSGLEDCYTALVWLHKNAAQLGIDGQRIGVKGESAGGGLAAALALLTRDRGEVSLAFQHLLYPMLDDRTCSAQDSNPYAGEFFWTRENNSFGWRSLLGVAPGSADVSPYAAAARADDLAALPPTFISVGALDLFMDEDIVYAHRLMRAGVPVELHVYPGGPHGFDNLPNSPTAQAGRRDSSDALRRALGIAN